AGAKRSSDSQLTDRSRLLSESAGSLENPVSLASDTSRTATFRRGNTPTLTLPTPTSRPRIAVPWVRTISPIFSGGKATRTATYPATSKATKTAATTMRMVLRRFMGTPGRRGMETPERKIYQDARTSPCSHPVGGRVVGEGWIGG